jgi:hypothetical protein
MKRDAFDRTCIIVCLLFKGVKHSFKKICSGQEDVE